MRGPDLKPRKERADKGKPKDPRNERIIGQICQLLVMDTRPGEIKKAMVGAYPDKFKKGRAVERYMAVARARVLTVVTQTPEESLARSLEFWADKKRTFEGNVAQARRQVVELEGDRETPGKIEAARLAGDAKLVKILSLRAIEFRSVAQSNLVLSMNAQREIDRLIGNHAPFRVARTTAAGEDVDRPAEREPLTPEEGRVELEDLLRLAHARGGTLDQLETHREN